LTSASLAAYQQANGGNLIGPKSLRTDPATPSRPAADDEPIATRREVRDTALRAHGYVPVTGELSLRDGNSDPRRPDCDSGQLHSLRHATANPTRHSPRLTL